MDVSDVSDARHRHTLVGLLEGIEGIRGERMRASLRAFLSPHAV
jgi:hypothetical protein